MAAYEESFQAFTAESGKAYTDAFGVDVLVESMIGGLTWLTWPGVVAGAVLART